MTPLSEVAVALLVSLVCWVAAFRIQWARLVWVACGLVSVGYAVAAAHELDRRDNGFLLSAAIPLIIAPVLAQGITRFAQALLGLMALVATAYSGWGEFIGPVLVQDELATIQTRFNRGGICIQTTDYTCGPAAAVTGLRTLGLRGEEGEIALLAASNPQTGTDPHDLKVALETRYASQGLTVYHSALDSLDALAAAAPALTVVNYGSIGHWIMVVRVTGRDVIFADPHDGMHCEPRSEFAGRWENETLALRRRDTGAAINVVR